MKKLNLFVIVALSYLAVGCTQYVVLFKPPAELDPVPLKSVEKADIEGAKEESSWALEAVGMDEKYFKEKVGISGNKNVKIAILSTGVDYNHEDLVGQFVVNRAEITEAADIKPSINFKDDDGNGKIDDIIGDDVVDGDGMAFDRHGAGTAVAGIIAAKSNGYGVKGMMDKVSLYPIRYINENGMSDVPKLASALRKALEAEADVVYVQTIDLPLGGGYMSNPDAAAAEVAMISRVLEKYKGTNIPIVVAAGDSNKEFGDGPLEEAFRVCPNVIVVTSVDQTGRLGLLASFGSRTVKIAAPGDKIKTTALNNQYAEVRGTAYAAAYVTGALGLAKSIHGDNLNLEDHIMPAISSTRENTPNDNIAHLTASGAVINVPKFLENINSKVN